ncbi:MAG: TPM domain-containing protein [Bacteroidales bacterium]|nr:TPM domain-containing protein [Bacteroidales bacterium]
MFVSQSSKDVFDPQEKEDIIRAIQFAEIDSSCEFKVHVDRKCPEDSVERADELFYKLDVDKTKARNGILFYVNLECRKFIIRVDEGVEAKIPGDFWEEIYHIMVVHFRKDNYVKGLSYAIQHAGEKLKDYFPWYKDDENEVTDDISLE